MAEVMDMTELGYPYKFTNPIAGKTEQRKTSLTVGLWGWFQIW
jgi:hypothetical protein